MDITLPDLHNILQVKESQIQYPLPWQIQDKRHIILVQQIFFEQQLPSIVIFLFFATSSDIHLAYSSCQNLCNFFAIFSSSNKALVQPQLLSSFFSEQIYIFPSLLVMKSQPGDFSQSSMVKYFSVNSIISHDVNTWISTQCTNVVF